jgi:curli biogenesis system outer membrane secretion channel CsgG
MHETVIAPNRLLTRQETQMNHDAGTLYDALSRAGRHRVRLRRARLAAALAIVAFVSPLTHAGDSSPGPAAGVAPLPLGTMAAVASGHSDRIRADRVAVAIYEFRSSLPNVSAKAATDMFTTALVQTGRFAVVERSRLNDGVVREKQLQQNGLADGSSETVKLRGARYIFEGTVSEANASEDARSTGIGIGGMQLTTGSNRDSLAIDVRIVDANTGEVLDALTIKQSIRAESSSFNGLGTLLTAVAAQRGRATAFIPDVNIDRERHEGVDAVLREAITRAVAELVRRFQA